MGWFMGLVGGLLFWPGFVGAAYAPRWAFFSVVIPIVVIFLWPAVRWTWAHSCFLALLCWGALTTGWSPVWFDGFVEWWHLALLGGAFLIGAEAEDDGFLVGASMAVAVSSVFAVAQAAGWSGLPQTSPPAGLFINRNFLAEVGALLLVWAVAEKRWWLVPGGAVAAFLPMAKGALIAVAVAAVWGVARKAGRWGLAVGGGLAALGVLFVAQYAMGRDVFFSSGERLGIWWDTLRGVSFFGNGLGSFVVNFPSHAVLTDTYMLRPDHVHNDFLELVYELGVPGALLVAGLVYGVYRRGGCALLVAGAVLALVGFPLHQPFSAVLIAWGLGRVLGAGALECGGILDRRSDPRFWRGGFGPDYLSDMDRAEELRAAARRVC